MILSCPPTSSVWPILKCRSLTLHLGRGYAQQQVLEKQIVALKSGDTPKGGWASPSLNHLKVYRHIFMRETGRKEFESDEIYLDGMMSKPQDSRETLKGGTDMPSKKKQKKNEYSNCIIICGWNINTIPRGLAFGNP